MTTVFTRPNRDNSSTNNTDKMYIVAIGASAGGMEAIHLLFDNTPEDGVAYVIVQHISPDHKSFMAELLAKHSKLQIYLAENDMYLESNKVYLMPKGKVMTIQNRRLQLTNSKPIQPNTSIDIFLDSLAQDQGDKSIAVILSGTGNDGTKGIASIKKQGGFVIVQEPDSAQFPGMPSSSIHSGNADVILAPELIPEEIIAYLKRDSLESNISNRLSKSDEAGLFKILHLIQLHTPLDFTEYKRPTIIRKIVIRMTRNNIETLNDYIAFLNTNHEEIMVLSQEFLISVTQFFRDKEAFEVIRKTVIPEIMESKLQIDTLKIWVVGCASGEEAYSLAILITEHLNKLQKNIAVKIFATDVDKSALLRASKGIYNESISEDVSRERLSTFFTKHDHNYKVRDDLRKMIVFADHDIIRQPPYGKIDLISCRNMLIYINPILQKRILTSLHFCLNMGGYLFLGPSESLGKLQKSFIEIDKKWKIYKNNEVANNLTNTTYITPGLNRQWTHPTHKLAPHKNMAKTDFSEIIHQTLLDESGYEAGICVNDKLKIIQTFGNYENYLLPKIFNFELLEMLPDELSLATSTTLRKALEQNEKIALREITFVKNDSTHSVDILVTPFFLDNNEIQNTLVILFKETVSNTAAEKVGEVFHLEKQTLQQIVNLKKNLAEVKLELKETYEALEESNNHLSIFNEEIISSNEEMQSSNEELQSVNEELQTVNNEYQSKIKELADLNDDLNNYFKSSISGQLYVDKHLVLKKFTPSAVKQINFKESDVGRLLSDISTNIKFATLIDDINSVMVSSLIKEKEVQTLDGRWYQMVIMPYVKYGDHKNDGAIITFNDITLLKRMQDKLSRINADHKTFIYTASHDLKVPVANIKMLITELKEVIDPDSLEVKELTEMIDDSITNFIDTIAELSDIAKIESDMYEYENVDVNQLIDDIKLGMKELLIQSKATITLDLKAPVISFSKKNLRSILFNLLNNAIKYKSADRSPEITISTEKIDETLVLCVKDNGLGLNALQIDKIFTKFKRSHDHVEGSGIGLYLVKRMIKNSGGSIKIESTAGVGTTFKVFFIRKAL